MNFPFRFFENPSGILKLVWDKTVLFLRNFLFRFFENPTGILEFIWSKQFIYIRIFSASTSVMDRMPCLSTFRRRCRRRRIPIERQSIPRPGPLLLGLRARRDPCRGTSGGGLPTPSPTCAPHSRTPSWTWTNEQGSRPRSGLNDFDFD
jgi:hypothetical protein